MRTWWLKSSFFSRAMCSSACSLKRQRANVSAELQPSTALVLLPPLLWRHHQARGWNRWRVKKRRWKYLGNEKDWICYVKFFTMNLSSPIAWRIKVHLCSHLSCRPTTAMLRKARKDYCDLRESTTPTKNPTTQTKLACRNVYSYYRPGKSFHTGVRGVTFPRASLHTTRTRWKWKPILDHPTVTHGWYKAEGWSVRGCFSGVSCQT